MPSCRLVCEFVGTFLLVFTVGCNSMGGLASFSALSIASVLMITVYMSASLPIL
jgi:glycerol uptake facilitator-like aquaporin